MILELYWIFFKFELQRLGFIYIGTIARKYKLFSGNTILHMAPVLLTFMLPLDNLTTFWDFDVMKLKINLFVLIPIYLWKLTIASVFAVVAISFMVEIPRYFK
jgi:hypothetical protein